jgi:hypothetical protein
MDYKRHFLPPPMEGSSLESIIIQACQGTPGCLFMVRCEFGPSSCSRLAPWLRWVFGQDNHAIARGLHRQVEAVCLPRHIARTFNPRIGVGLEVASRSRVKTLPDRGGGPAWTEVAISAPRGAA